MRLKTGDSAARCEEDAGTSYTVTASCFSSSLQALFLFPSLLVSSVLEFPVIVLTSPDPAAWRQQEPSTVRFASRFSVPVEGWGYYCRGHESDCSLLRAGRCAEQGSCLASSLKRSSTCAYEVQSEIRELGVQKPKLKLGGAAVAAGDQASSVQPCDLGPRCDVHHAL